MIKFFDEWGLPLGMVGIFLAGALLGGKLVAIEKTSELADLKLTHASAAAETAESGRQRLQNAIDRGNQLEGRLAKAEQDLQTVSQEHAHEIPRRTTGRACLNAGTVRLLDESAAGIHPAGLSTPGSGAPAADAAAAADTNVGDEAEATDTDVAGWIDTAQRQYGLCRARLQALIDWEEAPQ